MRESSVSTVVVSNDVGECRLIENALGRGGSEADQTCSVRMAGTLTGAIEVLAEPDYAPDVVLLSLQLPDAEGFDGLHALRLAHPHLPIIVIAELSGSKTSSEALQLGATDLLDVSDLQPRPLWRCIGLAIERKRHESKLLQLATTDALTGCRNRSSFMEHAQSAIHHAQRTGLGCAVIVFDVDEFKVVNDVHGHAAGDRLLVEIARRVTASLRRTDTIARLGGDEFAVIAPNLKSAAHAIEIAEKIRQVIEGIDQLGDNRIVAAASIGIAVIEPGKNVSADTLLSHADMAMYRSKKRQNGSINFYDERMDAEIKARYQVKRAIMDALGNHRFFAEYQPIVDARSREVVGAEALARWLGPEDLVVAPAQFIPIAEEAGWIASLADELLSGICRQMRQNLLDGGAMVPVSVNVSPIQLKNPNFARGFIACVEQFLADPRLIKVEVTESVIIDNLDTTVRNIHALRDAGIGVYIDDFGTGYCSLSLLSDLPIDGVKIDRTFVRRVSRDEGASLIVRAIVELSHRLSLSTIAEGVEDPEQVEQLCELGIDYLQGFHFSRPRPFQTFEQMLIRQVTTRDRTNAEEAVTPLRSASSA